MIHEVILNDFGRPPGHLLAQTNFGFDRTDEQLQAATRRKKRTFRFVTQINRLIMYHCGASKT